MILKQYVITLPADYDMRIIRERVATKGAAFDTLPGLGLKTFMIRERGRFGAESNQYAPAYLWPAVAPIWGFVAGEGFARIIESFGRPPIRSWLGLAFARADRSRALTELRSVTRDEQKIVAGTDLAALREREIAEARRAVENTPDHLVRAVGVNPEKWTLVRFDYWTARQDSLPLGAHSYEVLHVSAPHADVLEA
ncbi:DUF4865 family protein [Methylocapsa sp. S129]|uniref:DUF4865 family protein n=1 Tax=Methylocapsa sp. S129 TaxID=1641869 RepID=UPI00131C9105|nr:DUF4865 family protein [Methylocapsa sp. S129]